MVSKTGLSLLALGALALAGCIADERSQHEVACVGGTFTGAVLGGAIGNRFGGGSGQAVLTAAGAMAGGAAAATQMRC